MDGRRTAPEIVEVLRIGRVDQLDNVGVHLQNRCTEGGRHCAGRIRSMGRAAVEESIRGSRGGCRGPGSFCLSLGVLNSQFESVETVAHGENRPAVSCGGGDTMTLRVRPR